MKYLVAIPLAFLSFLSIGQLKSVKSITSSTVLQKANSFLDIGSYTNEQCLTHQKDVNLRQNTNYVLGRKKASIATRKTISEQATNRAVGTIYSIPVVFHVIHEGEPVGTLSNISDAQIMSAIDALNRDYRRTSDDGGIAQGSGPDTEIQFCLASKDPSGNPHSGINRVNGTSVTNYGAHGITTNNELAVKNLSRWDNRYYLNIWLVSEIENSGADTTDLNNFTGGTMGYAYLPVSPITLNSQRDGIVALHCVVGNDPNGSLGHRLWFAQTTNRTLTHEIGHFLGLQHPFDNSTSCSEVNCSTDGDEICDTPPTSSPSLCSSPSCPSTIIENYMDYTEETCKDMFTAGQSSYMRAVIGGVRNDLVNTTNCSASNIVAQFSANNTTITTGSSVSFNDLSFGAIATSWSWSFGGGSPNASTIQNPTITYNTPGVYSVTLTVSDGTNSDTETKTGYITVSDFDPLICDTLTNIMAGDSLRLYGVGAWGLYPGHNGDDITAYAEPFNVSSQTEVQKLFIPVLQADYASTSSYLSFVVYNDNSGQPGTPIKTENVLIADLNVGFYNEINFSSPVSVNGDFWVGIEINYTAGDTLLFGTAKNRQPSGVSTTFLRFGSSSWMSTQVAYGGGLLTSLYLDVLTSGSPIINFTETSLTANTGSSITFDGSSSVYSDFLWEFEGGNPATSTNIIETVAYNLAGSYNASLYAIAGCKLDSMVKQVVVSDPAGVDLTSLDENISIYPNPAKDELNVVFNENTKGKFILELINTEGKNVFVSEVFNPGKLKTLIDLNQISKGVYQLKISNIESTVIKKVVVR